ncbi:hypothetical protein [Nocardioides sp. InS609-2]|uniref:hypothetical protein n=1 Tax=Nocardioides sp. InS609-2 TaxID=2760705 RepID=UPI0020C0E004|nr:hypothetical protein [Nocardioides sp. InS609-2]
MAQLNFVQAAIAGANPGFVAASAGGDKVVPNDRGALIVRNGSGASITVTVAVPGNGRFGLPEPDVAIAVPAGADRIIGPFPSVLGDSATDNLVAITYSAVTTVTVAPIQI